MTTGTANCTTALSVAERIGLTQSRATWRQWWCGCCLGVAATCGWAGSSAFCTETVELHPAQQDRLIRVAGIIKAELESSSHQAAIVARSGLALQRLGQRYSHAGVSLRRSPNAPWSVRQLYFACDEQRPRIFDQGLSGFVLGVEDADVGFVSVLLLPERPEALLTHTALNDTVALQLLSPRYSANAHAHSTLFQNCNQWLAELLATAWSQQPLAADTLTARAHAQHWLREQGYQATVLDVGWPPLLWLASLSPWLHTRDHPDADLQSGTLRVSMPEGLEQFVRQRYPHTQRWEFCYTAEHMVLRRNGPTLPDHCEAQPDDTVIRF